MLSLSPAKLLVILVIALIVLGPEKLPQVARQLGAAWHDLRGWRSRVESEVRGTFPNLPPTHEVAQAVRSPFAFLDRLADEHERSTTGIGDEAPGVHGDDPTSLATGTATGPPDVAPGANGSAGVNGSAAPGGTGAAAAAGGATPRAFPAVPDDPSMN